MELKFMLASLIFAMTPGLATVYILSNSTIYGKREGLKSVLGVMSGGMIYNVIGSLILAVFVIPTKGLENSLVFSSIKILGATYLIYTGLSELFSKGTLHADESKKNSYLKGMVTNLANPKVLLFFITFIPQFLKGDGNLGKEMFFLGCIYLFIEMCWYITLALSTSFFTGSVKEFLFNKMKYLSGGVFILIGVTMFL
ncbi:MAG: LysE family translocator [Cetobacterium sp.]